MTTHTEPDNLDYLVAGTLAKFIDNIVEESHTRRLHYSDISSIATYVAEHVPSGNLYVLDTLDNVRTTYDMVYGVLVQFDNVVRKYREGCVVPIKEEITAAPVATEEELFDIVAAKKENPYRRKIRSETVDLYDIFNAYDIPYGVGHAIKKLFCLGKRSGGKTALQDLEEAHWTLGRAIEILKENSDQTE